MNSTYYKCFCVWYWYKYLSKSGGYFKRGPAFIWFQQIIWALRLWNNGLFIPPPWKLGVYSKPAFSFEKIRYSRFYLNSHTAKYVERSLSEVIFDSRQSALKPQKQKGAERLLPFVTTYHLAVKKNLTKSWWKTGLP